VNNFIYGISGMVGDIFVIQNQQENFLTFNSPLSILKKKLSKGEE